MRLSLLATHFERDLLGLECLGNDAHQANHFLARITMTLPSREWVGIDVQMDLCLSDRLLRKGTAGRNGMKTWCLKANLYPQNDAHLEGVDGTDGPTRS